MPLHLLGKKSWNVYNQDNIDRVRRDEASAKAREEEEERRMQEADAERRIQLLRGQHVAPPPPISAAGIHTQDGSTAGRDRKRRRIAGEDDTQRDIRLAREDTDAVALRTPELPAVAKKSSDAPLLGRDGHINLFPQESSRVQAQKNPEAEAEAAKKKREYEDQYTMRFSNAAGFKQGTGKPWYASLQPKPEDAVKTAGKDVWGNDDKQRKDRERRRMEDEDPLLAIRKGVSGLKEVENERRRWKEEREKEFNEMNRETSRRRRRDSCELEAFSLDAQISSNAAGNSDRGSTIPTSRRRPRHNLSKCQSRSRSRERSRKHSHKHRGHRSRHDGHTSRHKRNSSPAPEKTDNLARLRQERDEREEKEKLKAAAFLAKAREGDKPAWVKGTGRYSTQFADL